MSDPEHDAIRMLQLESGEGVPFRLSWYQQDDAGQWLPWTLLINEEEHQLVQTYQSSGIATPEFVALIRRGAPVMDPAP
jgi:hypothetical protein